jgi:hypothetical protein
MTETAISFGSLLKARTGTVEFVDVPEFGFAMVTGSGARAALSSPRRCRRCTR